MVKPELFKFKNNTPLRSRIVFIGGVNGIKVETLERAANGSWFVTLDIPLEFSLLDGRTVKVNKRVRLRGEQEGKRPNPKAFGRKKK